MGFTQKYRVLLTTAFIAAVFCAAVWRALGSPARFQPVELSEDVQLLFKRLHRNIYTSFETESESEVYDILAESTDDPLLTRIYLESYRSLLSRRNDGPEIKILDVNVLTLQGIRDRFGFGGTGVRFQVLCTWEVRSLIRHFTHWHPRHNNFTAIYSVGLVNGKYKIINDQVLWQRRVKTLWSAPGA